MEDRSSKLKAVISDEIKASGDIPFARYMELCLYHPVLGYYVQEEAPTGGSGDFYTAPHVHSLFGATIARWMQNMVDKLDLGNIHMVELGAGNGQLAEDILNHWETTGSPLPSVELVEESPHRRQQLAERFHNRDVSISDPASTDPADPYQGFVLANELLDAMPMRIVARTGDGLQEITVTEEDEKFAESSRPFETEDPVLSEVLEMLPEGFRTEFADGWRDFVTDAWNRLSRGALLTFDYGEEAGLMGMPWRAGGSLRCFHRHQVDRDPYSLPGEKDITANVNFSLMERYAAEAGFKVERLRTQSSFLVRSGILELLAELVEGDEEGAVSSDWLQVKNLIHDEAGMGEVFKVMVLIKD
jgi:SAM-dependent MidA family methyltransferase